jgi:hypothetical protein
MKNNLDENEKKFPKGHFVGMWMGIGIAIFSGIGVPISIIIDNFGFIGIGPAIGVVFGLSIGQSIENKYDKEGKIRPLTESEKSKRKIAIAVGIATLLLGIFVFSLMYFRK